MVRRLRAVAGFRKGLSSAPYDYIRQGKGVSAEHIDVFEAERREVRDIFWENFVAFRAELSECGGLCCINEEQSG